MRRLISSFLAVTALAGCATAQPVAVANTPVTLGFRRVVTDGSVAVGGTLLAPSSLVDPGGSSAGSAPAEQPLPDATITASDASGHPLAAAGTARSDSAGHFLVSGLTLDQPAFLRASFSDANGQSRTLMSFVRPEAPHSCVTISLASTLVSNMLTYQGASVDAYSQDKLQAAITTADQELPGLISADASADPAAGASGTPLAGSSLIDALTDPNNSAGAQQAATQVASSMPALQQAVSQALQTYLQVGFTLQETGENQFDYLSQAGDQTTMSGAVLLSCILPPGRYDGVSFWLGNQQIALAKPAGKGWSASFDTRSVPDGAYVLAAMARREAASGGPLTAKAFVVIDNTRPSGDNVCVANAP